MNRLNRHTLLLAIALAIAPATGLFNSLHAASCCGGSSATSLILPKFARYMIATGVIAEFYNGYWTTTGTYRSDPPGSVLRQYRLTTGGAIRISNRFQLSFTIPYTWNYNHYSGENSITSAQGDSSLSLTYEAFDNIMCVYKVRNWRDLLPALYFSADLLIPTGASPYSEVTSSFDITGRGFYYGAFRMTMDKTINPVNFTITGSYGKHLQRPVNRYLNEYIEPFTKQLGDRFTMSYAVGATLTLPTMSTFTFTGGYNYLREFPGKVDGVIDPLLILQKHSFSTTIAFTTPDKNFIFKGSFSFSPPKDGWGKNTATTNTISMEGSYVFR